MSVMGKVGSKGELFPPKRFRRALGIEPGTTVSYSLDRGRLVVLPLPTLEELLDREPKVVITAEEFSQDRKELSRRLEG
jgi:bifunctional DNA-binding transcriptional regulator/antitoxin component of YhaV-PrlF toxin-antitoxin module